MLESSELAGRVSARLVGIFADLEDTIGLVAIEEPANLQSFRQAIGCVCGSLVLDVMEPIYKAHPSVKPASWSDIEL